MSRNFELAVQGGYTENSIEQPVIGLSIFPYNDKEFNLPGEIHPVTKERNTTTRLLRVFDDEYRGSLEIISASEIEIVEDSTGNNSFEAYVELGPDNRKTKRPFSPMKQMRSLLAGVCLARDLEIDPVHHGDSIRISITKQGKDKADITYVDEGSRGFFHIRVPLPTNEQYDNILLGCELWAIIHQAIANAYDPTPQSQAAARKVFFIGQTSYSTASNTQFALLQELGTYNLDKTVNEKLHFGADVQGGLLRMYEDRLLPQSIDFRELALSVIVNTARRNNAISQSEIVMAFNEQLGNYRHDE
ncbi:MAG TPA: hypothetical protein VGE34_00990 [Candidatus Saccharimonadales bacterium]